MSSIGKTNSDGCLCLYVRFVNLYNPSGFGILLMHFRETLRDLCATPNTIQRFMAFSHHNKPPLATIEKLFFSQSLLLFPSFHNSNQKFLGWHWHANILFPSGIELWIYTEQICIDG